MKLSRRIETLEGKARLKRTAFDHLSDDELRMRADRLIAELGLRDWPLELLLAGVVPDLVRRAEGIRK